MEMQTSRRLRALIFSLLLLTTPASPGAILVAFDFDDPLGGFEPGPDVLHAQLASATWTSVLGTLNDFAGNPGRALSTSGFTNGNAFQLALTARPGHVIDVEMVSLDLRASASGPESWELRVGAEPVLGGVVTTSFTSVGGTVLTPAAPGVLLTLDGDGASSSAGTLRIDNVEIHGSVASVSAPPGIMLLVSPLAGMLLAAMRRHCAGAHFSPVRTTTPATRRRGENTAPA